jgi:hypothetical protein
MLWKLWYIEGWDALPYYCVEYQVNIYCFSSIGVYVMEWQLAKGSWYPIHQQRQIRAVFLKGIFMRIGCGSYFSCKEK